MNPISDIFLRPIKWGKLFKVFHHTFSKAREMRALLEKNPDSYREQIPQYTREWAEYVLKNLGVTVTSSGAPFCENACIIVSNHMSYLDIMAVFTRKHTTFVAKSEVEGWPIIGPAAATAGTLFVKRESRSSKLAIAGAIAQAVLEDKKSVMVFPEGTSSIEGGIWRKGIFQIAHDHKIPVQALSISYNPVRRGAYILDDNIFFHMKKLLEEGQLKAHLEVHEPILIDDVERDTRKLENWMRESLHQRLREQGWFQDSSSYV